ncbi:hypothetical protein DYB28_005150 [Aphanomyces astaci]|uniref:Uncharacterized protein n=1 Tax=Aphanomyces astaci TaxID=112090 RepID=A0A9X8E7R4_APHAT|nr:hypothetical protein DYB28_005150 [Aphanomyces astaci]
MSRLQHCTTTLKAAMEEVIKAVESKLAVELPQVFGLSLDGKRHFCAIFASYCNGNTCVIPLLAMSPLLKEDNLDANSHVDFIKSTLSFYDKAASDIAFITADNCPTNASIATSHKFNLAMQSYLADYEDALKAIHILMIRLGCQRPIGDQYVELLLFLSKVASVRDVLLHRDLNEKVTYHLDQLVMFESVTKKLHQPEVHAAYK